MNPDNVFQKNQNPVTAFLDSIGVAKVDAGGQATGATGGAVHMWDDQTARYNELLGASQGGGQTVTPPAGNAFLQPTGTNTPTAAPMASNAFLGGANGPSSGAPTGQTWINTAPGTRQANQDGSTPMIGRGAPVQAPAATPLSGFGQQVLNSPTPISRDGATFSGAGGKLSITQDMGTVPMGGKPAAGGVDPLAVARYQQALAGGGDVMATLTNFKTPIPDGVTLTEQQMSALAADDMRINRQALDLARRTQTQGMAPDMGQTPEVFANRMAYLNGLAGDTAATNSPAGDIRGKLAMGRPTDDQRNAEAIVSNEIATGKLDPNDKAAIAQRRSELLVGGSYPTAGVWVDRKTGQDAKMLVRESKTGRIGELVDGKFKAVNQADWKPTTAGNADNFLDPKGFKALSENIVQEENSIKMLNKYLEGVGSLPQGVDKMATVLGRTLKTMFTKDPLTPDEKNLGVSVGRQQALLGALRTTILGPGVLTEIDAQRILNRLGGDVEAITSNPELMKSLVQEVLDQKMSEYQNNLTTYNAHAEKKYSNWGAKPREAVQPYKDKASMTAEEIFNAAMAAKK